MSRQYSVCNLSMRILRCFFPVSCLMSSESPFEESNFMRLFVRHECDLRAYARTLLPTWEAVDDTIQEASVVMWKKREQLEDESGFVPWARTIVRFESLKTRRRAARDRLMLSEQTINKLADQAAESPEGLLDQERAAMQICLGKFTDEHRKLLLAPYLTSGGVRDIAEQSNRTANSLYKLLGRLREKLSHCVQRRLTTATEGGMA